jgi:heme-degrading monooxygenase HmoA
MKEMTKNRLFISVDLLQLIADLEIVWKIINEIWLAKQEKKDRKKKSRLEKSVNDEEDDDLEFVVSKFSDENDFIAFENENESENVSHAKNARHENLHTNYSIDDEFNLEDFFDDMND